MIIVENMSFYSNHDLILQESEDSKTLF